MAKPLSTQEKARRLWVKALRSGKYGWGKEHLVQTVGDRERFCCLGVLCEVAIKQGVISSYDHGGTTIFGGGAFGAVRDWVGLTTGCGDFDAYGSGDLTAINDEAKRNPFKRIANLIEKKPKGLFVDEVV